jgi:hypothetical protein
VQQQRKRNWICRQGAFSLGYRLRDQPEPCPQPRPCPRLRRLPGPLGLPAGPGGRGLAAAAWRVLPARVLTAKAHPRRVYLRADSTSFRRERSCTTSHRSPPSSSPVRTESERHLPSELLPASHCLRFPAVELGKGGGPRGQRGGGRASAGRAEGSSGGAGGQGGGGSRTYRAMGPQVGWSLRPGRCDLGC